MATTTTKTTKKSTAKKPAKAGTVRKGNRPANETPAVRKSEKATVKRMVAEVVAKTAPKVEKAPRKNGTDEKVIALLVTENPKRGASAQRFALYRNGMTVADFIAAGGKRADIAWDVRHAFISLK